MKKFIGILGYKGSVGKCVLNYLKGKYPIKCGQRSKSLEKEKDIKYVELDILNRNQLEDFCEECKVIINCAGPSYYLSQQIAEVTKEKNIDYVDIFGVNVFKTLVSSENNTIVLGAGSLPGLSGMLPAWINSKMDSDNIEKVNIYAGGNEEVTTAACVDYLLSIFNEFGKPNVYYYENKVYKRKKELIKLPEVFPYYAGCFEYLTEEMKESAALNKIRELHWYNVQVKKSYKDIMNKAFLEVLKNPDKDNIFKVAEKVREEILKDGEDLNRWYKIWIEASKSNRKESYGFKCEYSSSINGKIAAMCAEKLYSSRSDFGIYWPFQVLKGEEVLENMISKGILNVIQTNKNIAFEYELDYEEGEI